MGLMLADRNYKRLADVRSIHRPSRFDPKVPVTTDSYREAERAGPL